MKRNLLPFLLIGGVLLLGIGLTVALSLSEEPGSAQNEAGVESFEIQGTDHIPVGSAHPEYNSSPPTSGWHYGQPADWGVSGEPLPDEQLIHNLEHGGIWISYKGISDDAKRELERITEDNPKSVVMTPREANDAPIILAAWGKLLRLQSVDRERIQNFIDANLNKSPEPVAG